MRCYIPTTYGNTTGLTSLDRLGDDPRVREVCKERNPSGDTVWRYTAILQRGYQWDQEHFVDGDTVRELITNCRAITACVCEECKGTADGK